MQKRFWNSRNTHRSLTRSGQCSSEVLELWLGGCPDPTVGRASLEAASLRVTSSSIPLLHKTRVLDPAMASVTVMDAIWGHCTTRALFLTMLIFSWMLTSPYFPSVDILRVESVVLKHFITPSRSFCFIWPRLNSNSLLRSYRSMTSSGRLIQRWVFLSILVISSCAVQRQSELLLRGCAISDLFWLLKGIHCLCWFPAFCSLWAEVQHW